MNAMDRISSALAAAKTHAVLTTYASGHIRSLETRCAGSAENFAVGERRKIGRNLIDRETGCTVQVVSVEIVHIA